MSTTKRIKMIDPPSGWMYGFPAELPEGKDYKELLKEHNYPEDMIKLALRYSRAWFVDGGEDA